MGANIELWDVPPPQVSTKYDSASPEQEMRPHGVIVHGPNGPSSHRGQISRVKG